MAESRPCQTLNPLCSRYALHQPSHPVITFVPPEVVAGDVDQVALVDVLALGNQVRRMPPRSRLRAKDRSAIGRFRESVQIRNLLNSQTSSPWAIMRPALIGKSFRSSPDTPVRLVPHFHGRSIPYAANRAPSKSPVWSHLKTCTTFPAPYKGLRVGLSPLFVVGNLIDDPGSLPSRLAARLVVITAHLVASRRPFGRR